MRHYRVTLGDAVAAHDRAITRFGGRIEIQDLGRVEAAIARPYSGYYPRIHQKAVALVHAVSTNHGFVDGNKRTAFYLFHLLLAQSGYAVPKTSTDQDSDDIEHLILDLTTRFLDQEEATAWLKKRIRRID
jgi:death-on-curing protein